MMRKMHVALLIVGALMFVVPSLSMADCWNRCDPCPRPCKPVCAQPCYRTEWRTTYRQVYDPCTCSWKCERQSCPVRVWSWTWAW